MTIRHTRALSAISAAALSLAIVAPALAGQNPRSAGPGEHSLQQVTATPTPTATPPRGPEGRGPENAPGRSRGTPTGSATPGASRRDGAKTSPTLPPNASDRARTVVAAVFERNQQVRDLIAAMRTARGLPGSDSDEDVTDAFAQDASKKRTGDAIVDVQALTAEQREEFQTQLKAIMAAFAETLRQSADSVTGSTSGTPTPTPTGTGTPTPTATAQP